MRTQLEHVPTPQEVLQDVVLLEGSRYWAWGSRYERNPVARRRCLDYCGYTCTVCGFDFEQFYGELGVEYAQAHHVTPLHVIGGEYEVDPVEDLRPFCANCHFMLQSGDPIMTPEELRGYLTRV